MKLAIVTPLPPQHTGIADYASDLVRGLKTDRYDIDLFSNVEISSHQDLTVFNIEKINPSILNEYDLIIYQMGNNATFHEYMIELMKQYKGVVHLHDMVLHHLFAWTKFMVQHDTNGYYEVIEKWYGYDIRALAERMLDEGQAPWESEIVTDIPVFEEFLQYANACIVHSEFSKNKIAAAFPQLDVYKLDQLYKIEVPKSIRENTKMINFGVFGGVDPQKRVDIVLKAFTEIKKKNPEALFSLTIVGAVHEKCRYILDLPEKYNLTDNVKITDRVSENEFMEYLSDIDVLIALRYPTMGETSGVVSRALQLGIPCIVNDIGWYSELPGHIKKIPVDNMEIELENAILDLLNNDKELNNLKETAIEYSKKEFNFNKGIEKYSNILKSILGSE